MMLTQPNQGLSSGTGSARNSYCSLKEHRMTSSIKKMSEGRQHYRTMTGVSLPTSRTNDSTANNNPKYKEVL